MDMGAKPNRPTDRTGLCLRLITPIKICLSAELMLFLEKKGSRRKTFKE
jgi:hypothetical protein